MSPGGSASMSAFDSKENLKKLYEQHNLKILDIIRNLADIPLCLHFMGYDQISS